MRVHSLLHIHVCITVAPLVHEMHGRMHPNYCQITILLVVDLCSSLAYFMVTQPLPITGKFPIKTLVAKQLQTKCHAYARTHIHSLTCNTLNTHTPVHTLSCDVIQYNYYYCTHNAELLLYIIQLLCNGNCRDILLPIFCILSGLLIQP